jgi:uncharacterized protein
LKKHTIILKTIDFVKETLQDAEGEHDWWHTYRVWKTAKNIAESENVNIFIVELGALLHDIADSRGGNHEQEFRSPELDVIQDSDRLDALGAIGISRAFNYGGFKKRDAAGISS